MIDSDVYNLAAQARDAWLQSDGTMTGADLGAMFNRSARWGRERIREARNWRSENDQTIKQVGGTHYHDMAISPFEIIDAFALDFYSGNVLKYLLRAGKKPGVSRLEDLEKARHYLEELIQREMDGIAE